MGNLMVSRVPDQVDIDAVSGKGPRGKGDPKDYSLQNNEILVSIPRYQKLAAEHIKCAELVGRYEECAKNVAIPPLSCRHEQKMLNECINLWAHDLAYREEVTAEYLLVREEYRKTGRRRLYRGLKGETYITAEQMRGFVV